VGIRGAVIVDRRSLYGFEGLWVGTRDGLIVGAIFSALALESLWLGQRLLRRGPQTLVAEPAPDPGAAV